MCIADRDDDDPPPEPAPPEIPPRAQSLLASIKKLSSHTIKVDDSGDLKHEEFIPQNQHHGKYKPRLKLIANTWNVQVFEFRLSVRV